MIYESINDVGPTNKVIMYTRASEIHNHNTRYAQNGNFYTNSVRRTTRFGLEGLQTQHKVNIYGKYYQTKSRTVEQKNPSVEILNDTLSHKYLLSNYCYYCFYYYFYYIIITIIYCYYYYSNY